MNTLQLPDSETASFILLHRNDDVNALALQATRYPNVNLPFALQQISGWQTARHKLPLWSNTDGILFPPHLSLEQCSSEITAQYKCLVMGKGESFADLTGGFGVDCSYIARNFRTAHYVEKQEALCSLAAHNFPLLKCEHISVHCMQAEEFLHCMKPVDCLFLDPARRNNHGGKTIAIADCTPNVSTLHPLLMQKAKKILIKLSPMLDISQALKEVPGVKEVHIVSVQNECKELLLLLDKHCYEDKPETQFHCINFTHKGTQYFAFTAEEEQNTVCPQTSTLGQYLYEPNASLMKAGAFRSPTAKFGIKKLHPNSHLYTSEHCVAHFPGRIFEVESTFRFGKKELKALTSTLEQANLTVRNFPSPVAELRKRLKLRDGGNVYLFATTLADEQKVIIRCRKASI